jgi:hypothetical protein
MTPMPFADPAFPAATGGFSCGAKWYCTEMANCAEARFPPHARCGLSRLDRDIGTHGGK